MLIIKIFEVKARNQHVLFPAFFKVFIILQ
jgi:hypothetical protein